MTIANKITLSRIFLSILLFFLIIQKSFFYELTALIVLAIATISDYIDGKIAKSTHTVTKFGSIADPYADKILVMACFIAFAEIKDLRIPLWAIFLIIIRELTISTLRVLAALQNYVLKAEASGKFKTFIQFISIYLIIIILMIKYIKVKPEWLKGIYFNTKTWPYWLTIISSILTFISGLLYIINHRDIIKTFLKEKGK